MSAPAFFTQDGLWFEDGAISGCCTVCGRQGHIVAFMGVLRCGCGAGPLVQSRTAERDRKEET